MVGISGMLRFRGKKIVVCKTSQPGVYPRLLETTILIPFAAVPAATNPEKHFSGLEFGLAARNDPV